MLATKCVCCPTCGYPLRTILIFDGHMSNVIITNLLWHIQSFEWNENTVNRINIVHTYCLLSEVKRRYHACSSWKHLFIAYVYSFCLLFRFIGICLSYVLVSTDVNPVLPFLDMFVKYTVVVVRTVRLPSTGELASLLITREYS